ncbi:DUF1631 domain-containing protein [Pseudomonas argentinensis]|uniref:Uncharacterized protein n=1 Tax=Phytopseudomonas argentinensis TaxID=289370 RepID=A0A1I3HZP0_9GAMM|nr:DUF1631 domain-containing protein [Pseudomonas argentinensis]KAB0548036.1 DUF1631 domain-containing protein [Pseudomonas argentinensis]SFI41102.1 Protein of unknown function [Pseudomonas argentinensis]
MTTPGTPPSSTRSPSTLASRGIQPRFNALGQSCRKLVLNHLADHLARTFAQVDDTLFQCAEQAENNQVQAMFFDSMRHMRKLRPQIERLYHQCISQGISDFLDGKLVAKAAPTELHAEDLALIENEDYEEMLQVTNMAHRVQTRCAQALFALDKRLALLNNGQPLAPQANPLSPNHIAHALLTALKPSELPLRIKLVLYGLFDKQLMQGLDALYDALNQRLIDAGVLPNLKFVPTRSPEPATPAANTTADRRPGPPALDLPANPPADADQLAEGLDRLLAEYRKQQHAIDLPGSPSMASFAPQGARRTYEAGELLAALNRLQHASAVELAQHPDRPLQVNDLKTDLNQQLASHSDAPQQYRVGNHDTDVIDLVGMLFDFILDDDSLPQPYKVALSHLHTPCLKVALLDRALFKQAQHPARRLIDAMSQAGTLYGAQDDSHGLLNKVRWVVRQVVQQFNGDLRLFEALLGEFDEFVHGIKQRVELQERRAVETAKGRDKLMAARHSAAQAIAQALAKRAPPPIIRQFLERTWIDVLVFIQLRHGAASEQWRGACETADQLAWSGTLLDAAQRDRLQRLRVAMLDELRNGLMLLGGYHESDIRRLLQDLVACQHAVQAGQPHLAFKLSLPPSRNSLGAMLDDEAALLATSRRSRPHQPADQNLVRELENLEFGTWFDFLLGGKRQTLKLSWYSPTTHNYMFVDRNGQRAAVKSADQLLEEMQLGTARRSKPDRSAPMVDRALNAVYRVLQQLTGRTT